MTSSERGGEDLGLAESRLSSRGLFIRVCGVGVVGVAVLVMSLFRIYGVDTHHASRSGIWWPERGRGLIPPTATDITLRRDVLDHYAVYTVAESDLNEFLNERFSRNGKLIDSFGERRPVNSGLIGTKVGPFGWVVSAGTVVYSYWASNGGGHEYYHDPATGSTYQSSAYW